MSGLMPLLLQDTFFMQTEEKRKIRFNPPASRGKIASFAPKYPKVLMRPKL